MARMQGHRDPISRVRLASINLYHCRVVDVPNDEPIHPISPVTTRQREQNLIRQSPTYPSPWPIPRHVARAQRSHLVKDIQRESNE